MPAEYTHKFKHVLTYSRLKHTHPCRHTNTTPFDAVLLGLGVYTKKAGRQTEIQADILHTFRQIGKKA